MLKPSINIRPLGQVDPGPWTVVISLAISPPLFAATTFSSNPHPSDFLGLAVPILAAELVVIMVAMIAGTRLVSALSSLSPSSLSATLIFLAELTFVSFVAAPFPRVALVFLAVWFVHALLALVLSDRLLGAWHQWRGRFITAVGWGALAFCLVAYSLLLTVRDHLEFDWLHVGIGVSNVRQFGFYGLTAASIGAGLFFNIQSESSHSLWRNYLLIMIGSAMCFWSGGRAATGALFLVLCLAIGFASPPTRMRISLGFLAAIAIGAVLSLVWTPDPHYGLPRILSSASEAQGLNEYSSSRIAIWLETLHYVSERPLLGYGLGQFNLIVPSAANTYNHPHNAILQFLFQWGVVGTVAVLIMARSSLANIRGIIRDKSDAAGFAAICLLVAHLSMSMLEGNLFHVYPVSVVVFALAILATAKRA